MSNDKPVPGYRSLLDEEKESFIEDFKDKSNKWISMELGRMNKAFVAIARDRKMFYSYHEDVTGNVTGDFPNSEQAGGDVVI